MAETLLGPWLHRIGLALALLAAVAGAPRSPAAQPADLPLLQNVEDFWILGATAGQQEYRIQAEMVIYYYDPEWRAIWAKWGDYVFYLGASDKPLPFKTGQRVALDGIVQPGSQKFVWERTKIKVLEDSVSVPAPFVAAENVDAHSGHIAELEGLVSQQYEPDQTHVYFDLVVGDKAVTVLSYSPRRVALPDFQGAFVRMRGLLSVKRNAGQPTRYELWAPQPQDSTIVSWLHDDARFRIPATPIDELPAGDARELRRIEGTVHHQDRGSFVVVRDSTGEVKLLSPQTESLRAGERVEAIGYPDSIGLEKVLRSSVFRRSLGPQPSVATRGQPVLRLTEQVRELTPAEAAHHHPVRISGVVTFSDPATRSFFVQDSSGGIRVQLSPDSAFVTPEVEAGVSITGITRPGEFVPEVEAASAIRAASAALPKARVVTLEQARTGAEYGRWVEMRGYVRAIVPEGPFARLQLSTARGEFIVRMPSELIPTNLEGSVVQVQAVCDAIVNSRRQIVGVQLWMSDAKYLEIKEPKPLDPFTTPRRSIGGLLQFSSANPLNQRVQVSGVVIAHRPGEYMYLIDGDDSLLVLTRQADPLQPGDVVDAVGFPGYEGWRLMMRDAVFRRTGTRAEPEPKVLTSIASTNPELDGKLVQIDGIVVNTVTRGAETRFQLQFGSEIFDAAWHSPTVGPPPRLASGTLVRVTGVYRVALDEYGQPRAFDVSLRAADDVKLIRQPSWWTAARVLWIAGALLGIAVITIAWSLMLSRKNQLLGQAQRELRKANDELEARVVARTRDLQQEISERQRSQQALAEERKLLRDVIANLPVGLYVTDLHTRIVLANALYAQQLGAQSEADLVGRAIFDLQPAGLAPMRDAEDRAVLQTGEPVLAREAEVVFGEQSRWLSFTKVPLRDRDGRITGLIGITQDVTTRKRAETERENLHRQLLDTSRRAGMAEVATNVLHNVGNVLNSVNVSTTLLVDKLNRSKVGFVPKVGAMLEQNASSLAAFLTSDPRGQKLPTYLATLGEQLVAEKAELGHELEHLRKNIEHIKEIVALQQSFAKVSGIAETVLLSDLVEDAVRMNTGALERHQVQLVREYHAPINITVERHKVIQILINLIRNAKYACDEGRVADKRIILRTTPSETGVQISVIDNGVGIAPENLTRIFNHGFTTRKEGHGFGLHSGALAARELGGTLSVHSDGLGQGATFTLELPIQPGAETGTPMAANHPALAVVAAT